ncbi:MAG: HAMP domain-containing sensor histidine kinase [Opitutaceae bacterium]
MNSLALVPAKFAATSFRAKLMVAMMLVVTGITALAGYFAQRNLMGNVESDMQRAFQSELDALHRAQEIRSAALAERCRALVRKPRIHAALEDDALDLLYLSAQDELRDVMAPAIAGTPEQERYALHAQFYRFIDQQGALLVPPGGSAVGALDAEDKAQLVLQQMPQGQQIGYLVKKTDDLKGEIFEVIALPIHSTETGEAIAAIMLGFKAVPFATAPRGVGIKSGILVGGRLYLAGMDEARQRLLGTAMTRVIEVDTSADGDEAGKQIAGVADRFFYKRLNPESLFPPAYEVYLYPVAELMGRQRQLRWQVAGAGVVLLLGGLLASDIIARRLAGPVEKLAEDSADNLVQRQRAEAALELTTGELQRAARFSADASHQLKTPVTVLRAGLEELLSRENLAPEECHEISALIHQTYRLSSVIEDLLLLSRMDAGRLQIEFARVNLSQLIEGALDDLGALPDELDIGVDTDFPSGLFVAGEKRFLSLILLNLLENARKYNRPGGRIRISARQDDGFVFLNIGNTGVPIPHAAQDHIFERFHRGAVGENVPGYGLGLNLTRELARLHRGDVRLVQSSETWTEFEVRFTVAPPTSA